MWIDITTGAIALLHSDIRNMRPFTTLPENLTDDLIESIGFDKIMNASQTYDALMEKPVLTDPVLANDHWTYSWKIVPLYATQDELSAAINDAKMKKNAEINSSRLNSNLTSFVYQGKSIASDVLSRSDIDATNGYVSLFGSFPPGWPGSWKALDNTTVPISTIDDWKAFYEAMVNAGLSNFAKAQQLKTQLAAATTLHDIAAITW